MKDIILRSPTGPNIAFEFVFFEFIGGGGGGGGATGQNHIYDSWGQARATGGGAADVVGSINGGGGAPRRKCTRPSPSGGVCKNMAIKATLFCKGHACPIQGCTNSKSSSKERCAEHFDHTWDKRGTPPSTWEPVLVGKPSGTFVIRTSKAEDVGGVVAAITVVKPRGGDFFNQTIISVTGGAGRYAIAGSKHAHQSLEALVKFYQDPLYFAKSGRLDVPAQLIAPAAAMDAAGGAGGDALYEDMWWRDGGAVSGEAPSPSTAMYGTIYAEVGGGTLKEQKHYERIVVESDYAILEPYNPLDQLAVTPELSLMQAMEALATFVEGDILADARKALKYAATHDHLGKVLRPGGAALTVDDIAALHMYTMPTNFYSKMNEELGGYGKDKYGKVEHFLPVTKLLITAFEKLPPSAAS